jgi:hypothetical protein
MNVGELVEQLQKTPPGLPVGIFNYYNDFFTVQAVRIAQIDESADPRFCGRSIDGTEVTSAVKVVRVDCDGPAQLGQFLRYTLLDLIGIFIIGAAIGAALAY